jgi:ATP-dependent Clp protease ATP-binding subunit ClpC
VPIRLHLKKLSSITLSLALGFNCIAQTIQTGKEQHAKNSYFQEITSKVSTNNFQSELISLKDALLNRTVPVLTVDSSVINRMLLEELSKKLANNELADELKEKRLFRLDLSTLLTDSKKGDIQRLKQVLSENQTDENKILLVENIFSFIGSNAVHGKEVSDLLIRSIRAHQITCIGSTSTQKFEAFERKNPDLKGLFQQIELSPNDK